MSALNDLTGVVEEYPGLVEEIRQLVRAGAGDDDGEGHARTLGTEIADLICANAEGVSKAVLKQFLEAISHEELGRWYIHCFTWMEWPMWQWADSGSIDDETREQMREELLAVRDLLKFEYPDEVAVFDYLADGENDLGDDDAEVSALNVAKLWERRYLVTYQSWMQKAQSWAANETEEFLEYLYGVGTQAQKQVLDELQGQLGKSLAEGDEDLCYLDRTASGGGILCLKRRDD